MRIPDKFLERDSPGARIVRRNKDRGVLPDFAQAGDVSEDESAAGKSGFQGGETKRLVASGKCIDGRVREMTGKSFGGLEPEVLQVRMAGAPSVRMFVFSGGYDRPGEIGCSLTQHPHVLRLIP